MRYIQYKENGTEKYEELSILHSTDGYINCLKKRGCTDIKITTSEEIADMIHKYNTVPENKMQRTTFVLDYHNGRKVLE